MNVDNVTLYWFMFYIALALVGVLLGIYYLISTRKSSRK